MKSFALASVVAGGLVSSVSAQLIFLDPGQSCLFSFDATSLPPPIASPFGSAVFGGWDITVNGGGSAGCDYVVEMFENNTNEIPLMVFEQEQSEDCSLQPLLANVWQDLQGVLRVTAIGHTLVAPVEIEITVPSASGFLYYDGYINSPPSLSAVLAGGAQVQLAWPTNHIGYALESAPALPTASWGPVTNRVAVVGHQYSVVVAMDETRRFFRLRASKPVLLHRL